MPTYPKVTKPWRGYPSANCIMAIRLRIDQAPVPDPVGMIPLGTVTITPGRAIHVGTIPKGSFILPAHRQVKTIFNGTTPTLKIGTIADTEAILKTADSGLTTVSVTSGLVGNQMGIAATDLVLYAEINAVGATPAGVADFVIPFYIQKD
ncbi:MAG: hypothetical protein ABWY63_01680 [Hyphomicrobiaceae bacterium]